jgi:nucleotide-binding universal stress UspA family protein
VQNSEPDLKHVLCAIDLGPSTDVALQEADRVARRYGSTLTVLHVLPDGFPGVAMSPGGAEQAIISQQEMGREVGGFISNKIAEITGRSGDQFQIEIEAGTPHDLIVEHAAELHAGVIVVGSGGGEAPSTKGKMLLGSVAAHVTRRAGTSVLLARPRRVGGPVVAATDFSDLAPIVLRAAYAEAVGRAAPLVVLHSLMPDLSALVLGDTMAPSVMLADEARAASLPEARARLAALVAELPMPVETMVLEDPPGSGIPQAVARLGADLLVIGGPPHSALDRLVHGGSVIEDFVRACACSVLVTRPFVAKT